MDDIKKKVEEKMIKTINVCNEEYNIIRAGRASSALFEKIKVDYYGEAIPLNQVATISVPEARLVVIQPWDKTSLPNIEKAIQKSDLSVNPSNDGKVIRINIPPLTDERRKELVKMIKNIAEQNRIAIRNIRRDANEEYKKMQKKSVITDDEFKKTTDEIQTLTDKYINELNKLLEKKEKEIFEV